MTEKEAKLALAFLDRVQLQGQESDAFQTVKKALRRLAYTRDEASAEAKPMQQDQQGG